MDDWSDFVDACRRPLPTVVWANPLRLDRLERLVEGEGAAGEARPAGEGADAVSGDRQAGAVSVDDARAAGRLLARWFRRRELEAREVPWYPGALRIPELEKPGVTLPFYLGLMHVQEEVSLAPAQVVDPGPDHRVLDLCAAPGGKTAQLAIRMGNRGTLVANDVNIGRLRALRANCERLGILDVLVTREDGAQYPDEGGTFDRILLDVPCSCEGNVRTTAGADWKAPGEEFPSGLSGLQTTLLGRAWKLLRPGGVLVYATCTFAPEENEMVLDYVLGDDAEIEPFEVPGLEAVPGTTRWRGRELRDDCVHVARYWPHLNDTGGFAIARIRRSS